MAAIAASCHCTGSPTHFFHRFLADPRRSGACATLAVNGLVFILRHPLDIKLSSYLHAQSLARHELNLFNNGPVASGETRKAELAGNPD